MEYKLYYIKPIKVQNKDIDIVVCARCPIDARQVIKQHFMDEVANHVKCKPPFNNSCFYYENLLDKAEIFEINSFKDIPDKWDEEVIPWGLPNEYADLTCWAFINQMESEKKYQPLIGKKIVRMYNVYDTIHIELDDGSTINFEEDKYTDVKIKGRS